MTFNCPFESGGVCGVRWKQSGHHRGAIDSHGMRVVVKSQSFGCGSCSHSGMPTQCHSGAHVNAIQCGLIGLEVSRKPMESIKMH